MAGYGKDVEQRKFLRKDLKNRTANLENCLPVSYSQVFTPKKLKHMSTKIQTQMYTWKNKLLYMHTSEYSAKKGTNY